jgi:hypothetical protein
MFKFIRQWHPHNEFHNMDYKFFISDKPTGNYASLIDVYFEEEE